MTQADGKDIRFASEAKHFQGRDIFLMSIKATVQKYGKISSTTLNLLFLQGSFWGFPVTFHSVVQDTDILYPDIF